MHIKGHAESNEYGKDLICASTSILTYTFAEVVSRCDGMLLKTPKLELKEGEANIECITKSFDDFDALKSKLDVVVTGYELLEDSYPDHIRITKFG